MNFDPIKIGDSRLILLDVPFNASAVSIDFYNDLKTDILLHVGFRPAQNTTVCNWLVDGEWGDERQASHLMVPRGRAAALVTFWETHVDILLNSGEKLRMRWARSVKPDQIFFISPFKGSNVLKPTVPVTTALSLLQTHGFDQAIWLLSVSATDYSAANPDLEPFASNLDALQHFLIEGAVAGRSISADIAFSPEKYKADNPDLAGFANPDAARHFLCHGYYEGRILSHKAALIGRALLHPKRADDFPAVLVTPGLATLKSQVTTTAHALFDSLSDPDIPPAEMPFNTKAQGAALAYALLDEALFTKRRDVAARLVAYLMTRQPWTAGLAAKALEADIAFDYGRPVLDYIFTTLDDPVYTAKSRLAGARRLIDVGRFEDADRLLKAKGFDHSDDSEVRDQLLVKIRSAVLDQARLASIDLVLSANGRAALSSLESAVASDVGRPVLHNEALSAMPQILAQGDPALRFLIIGPRYIPQCKHYRIDQKLDLLNANGASARFLDEADLTEVLPDLTHVDVVILYRCMFTAELELLAVNARMQGCLLIVEHDDQIFDNRHFPLNFKMYARQITRRDHAGLKVDTVRLSAPFALAHAGLASTPALAKQMQHYLGDKPVLTLANMISTDEQFDGPYGVDRLLRERGHKKTIDIFYGAASKAHSDDFDKIAGPGILDVLKEHPQTRLVLIGSTKIPDYLDSVDDQIVRLPYTHDRKAYLSILASADIALAPLKKSALTNAKSAIKWMEAAIFGIPSVVSDTATFNQIVKDGETGFVASSTSDFRDALHRLVVDADLRQDMGKAAHEAAIDQFGNTAASNAISDLITACTNLYTTAPQGKVALSYRGKALSAFTAAASGMLGEQLVQTAGGVRLAAAAVFICDDLQDLAKVAEITGKSTRYRLLVSEDALRLLSLPIADLYRATGETDKALEDRRAAMAVLSAADQIACLDEQTEAALNALGLDAARLNGPEEFAALCAELSQASS